MLTRLPRTNVHRIIGLRSLQYSTKSSIPRFPVGKYIVTGAVAGIVGSACLAGAGYVWYLNSGIKRALDTLSPALLFLKDTKSELGNKPPSHVLSHLRQACKAYVAYLPGSAFLVDRGFDAVGGIVDAHSDEANEIIGKAYSEVLKVVTRDGNDHKTTTALEIASITRNLVKELAALGGKAGQPMIQVLELEKKGEQLKSGAAAAYEAAKSKQSDVSQVLAGALERAKEKASEADVAGTVYNYTEKVKEKVSEADVSSTVNKVTEKVRSIFPRSEK